MGTTIALTAAATFWIVGRGSRSLNVSRYSSVSKASSTATSSTVANSTSTADVTSPDTSAYPLIDDSLSYLCNSCSTEKYSPDQLVAVASSGSSPYKMVILVRTDLNMVHTVIIVFYQPHILIL